MDDCLARIELTFAVKEEMSPRRLVSSPRTAEMSPVRRLTSPRRREISHVVSSIASIPSRHRSAAVSNVRVARTTFHEIR
jgi:hypothetical protein